MSNRIQLNSTQLNQFLAQLDFLSLAEIQYIYYSTSESFSREDILMMMDIPLKDYRRHKRNIKNRLSKKTKEYTQSKTEKDKARIVREIYSKLLSDQQYILVSRLLDHKREDILKHLSIRKEDYYLVLETLRDKFREKFGEFRNTHSTYPDKKEDKLAFINQLREFKRRHEQEKDKKIDEEIEQAEREALRGQPTRDPDAKWKDRREDKEFRGDTPDIDRDYDFED